MSPRFAGGLALILAAAVSWSFLGSVSKIPMIAGVERMETAFWRTAFAFLCFAAHVAIRGTWRIRPIHALWMILFGFWGVGALFCFTQYAIELSGGATMIVLQYTAPVWVALFSRALFGERLTRRMAACMAAALAGTAMVCLSGGSVSGPMSVPGILCGLGAGFCYACHYPFCRWWQRLYDTATIYANMFLGGLLSLAVFAPVHVAEHSAGVWTAFAVLGVLCCYVAYYCYGQSLPRIGLVRAATVCYLEPVLSTIWLNIFWDESFSAVGWCGAGLVLGAMLVLSLERAGEAQDADAAPAAPSAGAARHGNS